MSMTVDLRLFDWWVISISWSIVFMSLAGIYIYADSKKKNAKMKNRHHVKTRPLTVVKDFVFVWVLFALLILYIVSINIGSSMLFAVGNIFTEAALIIYAVKNRTGKRPAADARYVKKYS